MLNENEVLYEILVKVIVEPDEDGFYAHAPALPGLLIDGATQDEALERAKEGIIVYLESLHKHHQPLPVGPDLIVRQIHAPELGFYQFGGPRQDSEVASQSYPVSQQVTISWPTFSAFGVS